MTDSAIVKRVEAIIQAYNPCNIRVKNGTTVCNGKGNGYRPCCGGCRHLTTKGCSVHAVACKFFFCPSSWELLPEFIQDELITLMTAYKGVLRFRFDGAVLTPKDYSWYWGQRYRERQAKGHFNT